jgi:hypothetical protein
VRSALRHRAARPLVASVLGLLVLAGAATGCAGHGRPGPVPEPSMPSPDAALVQWLEDAALTGGDLDGWAFGARLGFPTDRTPARPAACQPLDDALTMLLISAPPRAVRVREAFSMSGTERSDLIDIGLARYDSPRDAQRYLAAVRPAVRACRGGYVGATLTFTSVTAIAAPTAGDQSVAFHLSGDVLQISGVVVRVGPTLVLFEALARPHAGYRAQVPDRMIEAQVAKLERTQLQR